MDLPGRRFLRAARHAPDRLLHPWRRAAARRRVAAARPRRILVLCLGNICRSPFAERVLRRELAERGVAGADVRSGGFVLPGRTSPPSAREVAAEHGLDLSEHVSVLVTPHLAAWADLTLVMSRGQARRARALGGRGPLVEKLGDFDPGPIDTRAIRDPVERPREVFARVYDRIAGCCASVAETIADAGS